MSYHGDIQLGDTIDLKFTTRAFASGAPTTLSGSPAVAAYVGNGTTEITAGVTLTVDFDSRTGLNNVRVVATGGNGFAAATNIELVITAGTVGGTSVVGEVVGSFSIENRAVNWAKISSPTTSVALTGTSISTTQKVDVDTIKTNPVVNAGTITFPTTATLASMTNITAATGVDITKILGTAISTPATAGILDVNVKNMNNVAATPITTIKAVQGLAVDGVIPTATNLTNAPTNGDFTAAMKTSLNAATPVVTLAAAAVQAIWDALTSALTTVGSIGKLLVTDLDATVSSRATPAQVLTQVEAGLSTDTYAEPGQGAPAATASLASKIGYLYKAWRNRTTQTATQYSLLNDDTVTVDQKASFSDNGTTADRGEVGTGP